MSMSMYKTFFGLESAKDGVCLEGLADFVTDAVDNPRYEIKSAVVLEDLLKIITRIEQRLQVVEAKVENLENAEFHPELRLRAAEIHDVKKRLLDGAKDDSGLRKPLNIRVKHRVTQEAMQYVDAAYKKGILTWLEDNAYVMSQDHSTCSDLYVAVEGGAVRVSVGSWIVKGVHGELNVLSEEMFEDIYEIVK